MFFFNYLNAFNRFYVEWYLCIVGKSYFHQNYMSHCLSIYTDLVCSVLIIQSEINKSTKLGWHLHAVLFPVQMYVRGILWFSHRYAASADTSSLSRLLKKSLSDCFHILYVD